ncbi:MAG TPA: phytanoyl-CoA dioxygenase family protein [Pseudonocardia sp.]|nr:phytanoyl-CoA dioxygenase family protein [Pseudonocardia sp.]
MSRTLTPTAGGCRLDDLLAVLDEPTDPADYPHATEITQGVLVYDAAALRATPPEELARAFADGPGIVLIRDAVAPATVHRASAAFEAIIAEQHAGGAAAGDHFARPGANDRIWNALQKLAVRDPETFVEYYANDVLAAVSHAWLGPAYQVTSQPNVVNPGGAGQVGHRDYHLGFLPAARIEQYPAHVHLLSPVLTLQGAIAHTDMPVETGPTCYLPHSQKYAAGYLATGRPEFRRYFDEHHVQLPLRLGDAAFFNPAVIHGAGTNRTKEVRRMANLLQVSSAFGRAMETVDRELVCNAVYPALLTRAAHDPAGTANAVAAAAEGYPFPTNLDSDPPLDGLAPPSQADLVHRALTEHWTPDRLRGELSAQSDRRSDR